jgi:signal transduction histidine kinase
LVLKAWWIMAQPCELYCPNSQNMSLKHAIYRSLLVFIWLACNSVSTFAIPKDTVQINKNTHQLDFHTAVSFFIDSLHAFSRQSVGDEQLITALKNSYLPGTYKGGNIWCRFHLQNESASRQEFVLEVGGFKEVHVLYHQIGTSKFQEKITGNYIEYPRNEMGNKGFMDNKVKVSLTPKAVYEFICFYPDPGFDQIQPEFVISSSKSWEADWRNNFNRRFIIFLPFLGIGLILTLISFIYYFIHRDKTYLNYTAYIIASMLFAAVLNRFLDFVPLIGRPILYHFIGPAFIVFLIIAYFFFVKSFLGLKVRFPFWNKALNALSLYLLFGLGLTTWLMAIPEFPITAYKTINYFLLGNALVAAVFAIQIFRHRKLLDVIFLLGFSVLILQAIASVALSLTGADDVVLSAIFQLAVLIELTIFNVGLGVKLRLSMREREAAQLNLIDQLKENDELQKSTKHQLEVLVQSRTAEIQTQNEELITQQEELAAQRDMLEDQNSIIAQSMNELQQIRAGLEKTVKRRTAELKHTNVELVHRNDQLEQYAYITAHNLRAPVARLKGLIFLFEKTGGEQNENQGIFEKISNSASEMDDVLSDMNTILEVKANMMGRIDTVKIRSVLEKVQKALGQDIIDSGAALQVNIDVEDICGNRMYLESILYNLLSNSIKYRSAKRPLQIGLAVRKENGQVIMEVSDNGVGIDLKKFGDKVFKLYQRFHEYGEGKGLGLYLVKSHVEAMGGSIGIESEVDAGTMFRIILPE